MRFFSDRDPYFKLVDQNGDLTSNSGLLLYNNGIVCASKSLNKNAATAICTEMGYNSSVEWETGDKWNVQNSYSIKMGNVKCENSSWSTCTYSNSPDCDPYHRDDIFLTCKRGESALIFFVIISAYNNNKYL